MEAIGRAEQIIENSEKMESDLERERRLREKAEERTNSWLRMFFGLLCAFVLGIFSIIILWIKMNAKGQQIDAATRVLYSMDLGAEDKNLLLTSLGGSLIDRSRNNKGDED